MSKECKSLQKKVISTSQVRLFLVSDVPVCSLPSSRVNFIPCEESICLATFWKYQFHSWYLYCKSRKNALSFEGWAFLYNAKNLFKKITRITILPVSSNKCWCLPWSFKLFFNAIFYWQFEQRNTTIGHQYSHITTWGRWTKTDNKSWWWKLNRMWWHRRWNHHVFHWCQQKLC